MPDEEVDVVRFAGELDQLAAERAEHPPGAVLRPRQNRGGERLAPILDAEDEVDVEQVDAVSAGASRGSHQPIVAGRRYRVALSREQEERLGQWAGSLRALWNAALEQRQTAWRRCGTSVGLAEQCRDLTDAREAIPWLCEVPAQAAQQTLGDLDRAFVRFFRGEGHYPRFRSRRRDPGIRFPQRIEVRRVNRRWGEVKLAKLGWMRFRWTRGPGGRIKHATLTRDALGWHLSLCVELKARPMKPNGGPPLGIDRGVAALVATSDGELVRHEFWTEGERRRYRALQMQLARQRRRSRRRERTVRSIAGLRARVARRRRDALHKLSHRLTTNHGLLAVEDLDVRAMTRSAKGTLAEPGTNVAAKAGLNREILERSWGELRRQLTYKCEWYGSKLEPVPAHHTSQTCSACNVIDARSRESQARFRCRACGHTEHADVNAARVICARALDRTAGGPPVAARGGLAVGRPAKREPTLQEAA
jgi:putative transposase